MRGWRAAREWASEGTSESKVQGERGTMNAVHARLAQMSMYSELLKTSLHALESDRASDDVATEAHLLRELADRRLRLACDPRVPDAAGVPSRIACEIDYDIMLMMLCRLHRIPSGSERFTRPLVERRRLEDSLAEAGVDLKGRA